MSNNIVVIDFCGTIVDFQSFNPFMEFCLTRKKKKCFLIRHLKIRNVVQRINVRFFKRDFYKQYLIRKMKGFLQSDIQTMAKDYYDEVIKERIIKQTISRIEEYQENGAKTLILSAGGSDYIKLFAKEHGIDCVIANEFKFDNGKCVGRLKRLDCIGNQKVTYLKEALDDITDNPIVLAAISDSDSDLPILDLAKEKIVISYKTHQLWVKNDMEEIIYG